MKRPFFVPLNSFFVNPSGLKLLGFLGNTIGLGGFFLNVVSFALLSERVSTYVVERLILFPTAVPIATPAPTPTAVAIP